MNDRQLGSVLGGALYLLLGGSAAAGTYEAPMDVRKDVRVKFAAEPRAKRAREGVNVSFSVSAPTDVEVAVLDSGGKVVRHLAAGLLGKNAPAPFRKNSLRQEVLWDGKDDMGRPALSSSKGPFKVRVRLCAKPRLEKIVGWDGNTIGGAIVGLAVGRGGELYMMTGKGMGRSAVRAFDRNGRYLRTIMPYPANTSRERTAPVGQLDAGAERLPIVYNAHGCNLSPLTSGMKKQDVVFSPRGHLIMVSAVGTIAVHRPPRHLLALHVEGGAPPELGFVGPEVRRPRGFMGGAGEAGVRYFDHLALSPDDEYIYFVPSGGKEHHALFRLNWTDQQMGPPFLGKDGEPGADDAHFNDPQGVATDGEGRLYVCDRGNNRVMVFGPTGKLLGKFAVQSPEQIAVHPPTGAIYIVTRSKPRLKWVDVSKMSMAAYRAYKKKRAELKKRLGPPPPVKLLKFSAWGRAATRELAGHEVDVSLMALDPEASPPVLWASVGGKLVPIAEKGDRFEVGDPVSNFNGLNYPSFVAADPARGRVLVRELYTGMRWKPIRSLDLATGKKTSFLSATEVAVGPDGALYGMGGYGSNAMFRYDSSGRPLPFPKTGSNRIETGKWSAYGPNVGLRGHCVALNGDIYLMRSGKWGSGEGGIGCRLDVFGPDGTRKKSALIDGLGYGDCGIGLDARGNIYLGANVKPADEPYPGAFAGRLPAGGWLWWRGDRRERPWCYTYYNPYLYHWGSVFKFGPAGGAFYGRVLPWFGRRKGKVEPSKLATTKNAPAGAAGYRSGYLKREVRVEGALWRYGGMGIVPASDCSWGDPSCICMTSRLAVDEYGRVFFPNVFRFSVEMLDTNGNHLMRVGRYGNADSAGPGSKIPEPEIAFAWPAFVSAAGGKVYVSDSVNRRVTVVRFEYADAAECSVR